MMAKTYAAQMPVAMTASLNVTLNTCFQCARNQLPNLPEPSEIFVVSIMLSKLNNCYSYGRSTRFNSIDCANKKDTVLIENIKSRPLF